MSLPSLKLKERIVLAIDTSDPLEADRFTNVAKQAGAKFVKFGLELATATSWKYCAQLAARHSIDWIADAKLDDIPNTTAKAVENILSSKPKAYGITVHGKSGVESLKLAQRTAGHSIIFGVTELTSISDSETKGRYGLPRIELVKVLTSEIMMSGVGGIVTSGRELRLLKSDTNARSLVTLIPGIRSRKVNAHDQQNIITPAQAIRNGADLIVVGREVTRAEDPDAVYAQIVHEVESINL